MLDILMAQIRYRKRYILFISLAIFSLQTMMAWTLPSTERDFSFFLRITLVFLFGGSLILQMMFWVQDLKERRLLLLLNLPFPKWKVGASWLLVPLVLQVGLILLTTIPCLFWVVWTEEPGKNLMSMALAGLMGVGGWVLAFFYFSYLFSEISILISRSPLLVGVLNIALLVLIFYSFSLDINYLDWVQSHNGVFWGWAASVLCGALALIFLLYRKNYLMGIHPVHGLPQDWSESSAS